MKIFQHTRAIVRVRSGTKPECWQISIGAKSCWSTIDQRTDKPLPNALTLKAGRA